MRLGRCGALWNDPELGGQRFAMASVYSNDAAPLDAASINQICLSRIHQRGRGARKTLTSAVNDDICLGHRLVLKLDGIIIEMCVAFVQA